MKVKRVLNLVLIFFCLFVGAAIAKDDIIEIKIIKDMPDSVEANIRNLSDSAKKMEIDKMSIIGRKNKSDNITQVSWDRVMLKDKKIDLSSAFESKIILTNKIEQGDTFKAKGDYKALTDAIEKLLDKEIINKSIISNKIKPQSQGQSSGDVSASSGSNSSKLSTLSSLQNSAANISSSAATGEVSIPVTTSCAPRVDYQLNKVFLQERTTTDGKETQGCKDTSTSFTLQKDYQACPTTIDVSSKKIIYNFQFFYIDEDNGKNVIDNCKEDTSRTQTLKINKTYEGCSDFINLSSNIAYSQYKQSYRDIDGKEILVQDCTVDSEKSYFINEDYNGCTSRHLFDTGYSVAQSRFYYTKDQKDILVQDCQDTEKKYQHVATTETCSPVVNNSQVTIFNRKYIIVDGIKQYITECSPVSSNVTIKSENCITAPFTHDFTTGQSFQNKNYYYLDLDNNRVEVSTCIKSEISFVQQDDSSVCSEENDDVNFRTYLYSKKYITVDGLKKYITDCAKVTTPISYKEIGYKWNQEYNVASASISVANSGDNTYLGSAQGEVVWHQENCASEFENKFIIGSYSTTNKCKSYTSPSYNGSAIDMAYSTSSTITYDNYVENKSSAALCRIRYAYQNNNTHTCSSPATICATSPNTLYYQHCNNYKCPIYKFVKKPVLQRRDGTKIINETKVLSSKYTCGNNSLNGLEVLY